jgi:hypothetical protein
MQPKDFIKIEQIVDERIGRHLGIVTDFLNDQFTLLHEGQQNIIETMSRKSIEHTAEINQNKTNIDNNSFEIINHEERIKILEKVNQKKYA